MAPEHLRSAPGSCQGTPGATQKRPGECPERPKTAKIAPKSVPGQLGSATLSAHGASSYTKCSNNDFSPRFVCSVQITHVHSIQ